MVYIFLANGFEEVEALTSADVLRRSGIETQIVGIGTEKFILGAHKIKISSDIQIDSVKTENIEGIVLPGGMPGAENLYKEDKLYNIVDYCIENKKIIAAICAAPIILGRMGFLKGKNVCCYPGFENELKGAKISNNPVCVDENIITANGPGASFEFSFEIVKKIKGKDTSERISLLMQCI